MLINWKSKGVSYDQIDVSGHTSSNPRNQLILDNIHLALRIAGIYGKVYPRYKDEFLSISLLALVEHIERPLHKLVNSISYSCRNFLRREKRRRTEKLSKNTIDKPNGTYELLDMIESLELNELEDVIIKMRAQGFNDSEIAERAINLSCMTVGTIRKRVEFKLMLLERKLDAEA